MQDARELLFDLPRYFRPEVAGNMTATTQYMISRPVHIRIENGQCSVHDGIADHPDVTIRIRDDHLVRLMSGRMNGLAAFLTGKLKVDGDHRLAQKMNKVFDTSQLKKT